MFLRSLLIPLIFSGAVYAAAPISVIQKVDVLKDLGNTAVVNLYDLPTGKKAPKLSSLAQLKNLEIHGKWNECVALAPKVYSTSKDIKGWVALSWLRCLPEAQDKKMNESLESKALQTIGKDKSNFEDGPWVSDLWQTWLGRQLDHLDSEVKNKNQKIAAEIEQLLEQSSRLNKDQKSWCYQLLGDLALDRVDYKEARFMYEEAQSQKDSKYLTDKLDFLAKTRGEILAAKTTPPPLFEALGEDGKLEERVRLSLKQNDLIPALKDTITLLNQYPGSRSARRLKDKPLEIYNLLSDKLAAEKALNEMQNADTTRLMEWAQNLHRRGDWLASIALAQKAYVKNPLSPGSASALWVAGRSAQFMGQYDKALEFFTKLYSSNNGSDEAAEALFRSALIYFRKKDYATTSALLERLLQQGRDRYDLIGQYWLVRSLQQINVERATAASATLLEKYPFSYYGLRLSAEAQGNKITWPDNSKTPNVPLETEMFLTGLQKKSWNRFKILSAAGWVTEAQAELVDAPPIKDPTLKVSFADVLSKRQQYFAAIRLVNDALEADPRLRREQFLKIGYPEVFTDLYQKEATRYGIDVILLRSLTRQESGFNMRALSTSNAMGLMQMIPPTAQDVAKKLGIKIDIPNDMFRPEVNIPMGSFYISQMLDQFQANVPFALAAYNAGPQRLKNWIGGRDEIMNLLSSPSSAPEDELWIDELPWNETSFYVKAILRNVLLYHMIGKESYSPGPVLWQDLLTKKAK